MKCKLKFFIKHIFPLFFCRIYTNTIKPRTSAELYCVLCALFFKKHDVCHKNITFFLKTSIRLILRDFEMCVICYQCLIPSGCDWWLSSSMNEIFGGKNSKKSWMNSARRAIKVWLIAHFLYFFWWSQYNKILVVDRMMEQFWSD